MPAKFNYLSVELSKSLKDAVTDASEDGNVYSRIQREGYLNSAMQRLFNTAWSLSIGSDETKFEIFSRLMPDLIKIYENITPMTSPTRIDLTNKQDVFKIISIFDKTGNKYLTQIPQDKYLIAVSRFNLNYQFDVNRPAYSVFNDYVNIIPSNYPANQMDMLYIKRPMTSSGNFYSYNGVEDIPFSPNYYTYILEIAKAMAMFESNEISYAQMLYQINFTELQLMRERR